MNPLDWSLIVGLLPVILLVSLLLEFAWLAAGRNVPVCSPLRRGAPGGSVDGAALMVWLTICAQLIVMVAGGVIASRTWLTGFVLAAVSRSAAAHYRALVLGGARGYRVFVWADPVVVPARPRFRATSGFSWAARISASAPRQRTMYPRRDMKDGSDVRSFSGGRNWRVRSGVLEHREGRLASRLGVTERA